VLRQGDVLQSGSQDASRVRRRIYIDSAGIHRSCPHILIGQAMRANDAGFRKLTRKVLDIGYRSCFHVKDSDAGTVFGDAAAQLSQGLDLVNCTKSIGKGGDERLCGSRIALQEYDIERLHYFPLLLPLGTATGAVAALHGGNAVTDVNSGERCSN